MKSIGIVGGMSSESTALYYQIINREINRRLGGNSSAELLIHSLDFEKIVNLQKAGDWATSGMILAQSAAQLEKMGAQAILLATNTMHKVASQIEAVLTVPFIHVIEVTANTIKSKGLKKVGLLGTRFTMNDGFYSEKMRDLGVDIVVPSDETQCEIHRIIFEELCVGVIKDESRHFYQQQIESLHKQGAEGVILGCTEIGLLIAQEDSPIAVFDSTEIHAMAAVAFILS